MIYLTCFDSISSTDIILVQATSKMYFGNYSRGDD